MLLFCFLDEHLGRLYIDPFMRPNKTKTWHSILGRRAFLMFKQYNFFI